MKTKKTKKSDRKKYRFEFVETGYMPKDVLLTAGRNGVSAEDIAMMHRLDDREVESNMKAINPEYSLKKAELKAHREKKREYAEKWSREFLEAYGYVPNEMLVNGAVKDEFSFDWTSSLDGLLDGDGVTEGAGDKTMVIASYDNYQREMNVDYKDPGERLKEIIDQLTERQRLIYEEVIVAQKTKVSVAAKIGISDSMVSREEKKILATIKNDEILKKFFR